jgi:carbon storage regulator
MLVLTRRLGEEIIIGGNVRVSIVAIQGDRIRLGIKAPAAVCVDRKEIHERRMNFAGEQACMNTVSQS